MFTIDLLKGEGLPEKGKAKNLAFVALVSAVPVVVAIVMFGFYVHGKIDMSIEVGKIENWQKQTEKLSEAVAKLRQLKAQKTAYGICTAEVDKVINRHTQWSPILATLVTNMPESVVLTNLEVKQRSVRMKVPVKNNPGKTRDVSVTVPTLRMNVAAMPQSQGDKDVKEFRTKLLASDILGSRLENITVSQKDAELSGLDVVSWEINCLFKPKL
ncbi:MAG: PilN domain-containing protein [Planctomycetota bacterium]|jgi:Tfp pilus assembly protein PilN